MRALRIILVILLVFVAAWSLLAADPPATVQASRVPAEGVTAVRPPVKLSPMMAEIQTTLEASRLAVAELSVRFKAAGDEREALDLATRIASAKLEGRLEMLRIQLRYARDEGREEAVTELEEAITRMTAPPRTGQPIARPAPRRPINQ